MMKRAAAGYQLEEKNPKLAFNLYSGLVKVEQRLSAFFPGQERRY